MKARIKFRKSDTLRFIGHLDVMRFFQKVMRRAGIPIAFTGGYSPHMIMSFASPLGIGLSSNGEYLDIELKEPIDSMEAVRRMNEVSVDGIEILSLKQIPDSRKMTGMAILAGADYLITPDAALWNNERKESFRQFMEQEEIRVVKQTKRSEREVDIKPMIYRWEFCGDGITVQTAAGSSENLKPDLIMDAFASCFEKHTGEPSSALPCQYKRLEMYADTGENGVRNLVPLDALGEEIKENSR